MGLHGCEYGPGREQLSDPETGRNFNDAGPAADGPLEDRSIAAACGPFGPRTRQLPLQSGCASPESHKVSEWGRTYLSRLRFLHRQAFRLFWRWKSQAGRPRAHAEVRRLIREMASDNPTWGAPRIHGELLKLGFDVSEPTVSRYLERIRPEPRRTGSQTWSTFLRNQA